MPLLARLVFAGMCALFVYAAYLNLNDTDAALWVGVYGVSAVLTGLAAGNHPAPAQLHIAMMLGMLLWAIHLYDIVFQGAGTVTPMFPERQLTGNLWVDTEEGRELGGLLICAATLAAMAAVQRLVRYRRPRGDRRRY